MKKYTQEVIDFAKYAKTIKHRANLSPKRKTRYTSVILQLIEETSFLPDKCKLDERLYYIEHNMHKQLKCPVCENPTRYIKGKLRACSVKCGRILMSKTKNTIDPKTGLTNAQMSGLKTKEANLKIDPETGLNGYQKASQKADITKKEIDPESGLSIYKSIGLKTKESNSKIDPETGLNGYQKASQKAATKMKIIDPETGLTTYEKTFIKIHNTKSQIDPETGLTIYQSTGLKIKESNLKIDPETGLNGYQIIAKKQSITKKNQGYPKFLEIFNDLGFELLTSFDEYSDCLDLFKFKCKTCDTIGSAYYPYIRCQTCTPYNRSKAEIEIIEYISTIVSTNIQHGSRKIIPPLEIDINVSDYNFAIEYDGLMYHSYGKSNTSKFDNTIEYVEYHLNKTLRCKEKGIQLFHIFENEWIDLVKQDIWKSIISNKLGVNDGVYARKCEIKDVSSNESKEFLKSNHLQGWCPSSIQFGLYYEDELVSVMTFGKSRFDKEIDWELLRFCNKKYTNVIGGASRLFKQFLKENFGSVISYADIRHSTGNLYSQLGFEYSHSSKPNYYYFKDSDMVLHSRQQFQKHKLKDKLEFFDESLTESENMNNNGYRRIYDCGNQVWIYKNMK